MKKNKIVLALIAIFFWMNTSAAFTEARIKVTGITCSMCSNAVNKALTTLQFVNKVEVDLEKALFKVTFKSNEKVVIDELRQKVEGAGFSIGELIVDFNFSELEISNETFFPFENNSYHFIQVKGQILKGLVPLKFIDKGLTSPNISKKYSAQAKHPCIKTGNPKDCGENTGSAKIYHVTI